MMSSPRQCSTCGYELTGLQNASCPECGASPVVLRPRVYIVSTLVVGWVIGCGISVMLFGSALVFSILTDSLWPAAILAPFAVLAMVWTEGDVSLAIVLSGLLGIGYGFWLALAHARSRLRPGALVLAAVHGSATLLAAALLAFA